MTGMPVRRASWNMVRTIWMDGAGAGLAKMEAPCRLQECLFSTQLKFMIIDNFTSFLLTNGVES